VNETADHCYDIFSRRFWFAPADLRPLGLMRIAFGAALFWSTADLAPVLSTFFSDRGVAPRGPLLEHMVRPNRISVFDVAGPGWVLVAMYALTLFAILAFAAGWHARLANVAAFVLVSGLHERNLAVLDSSDTALRVMLFWLMFLPTGARLSVDARRRAARGDPTITHAPALPLRVAQVQVAWIYLDTALCKWPGASWHDGTALRTVLGLDHVFTRPLGEALFPVHWFSVVGTRATLAIEFLFLPLVFWPLTKPAGPQFARLPGWLFQPSWKALALAGGTALHLGIASLMSIGNFTCVMLSTYFLFFEPEWIAAIVRFSMQSAGLRPADDPAETRPWVAPPARASVWLSALVGRRATAWLCALPLPLVMLACIATSCPESSGVASLVVAGRALTPAIDLSPSRAWPPLREAVEEMELWQRWNMFAPQPMDHDVYLVGRGELADGTAVDVLRGVRGHGGPLVPPVQPGFFYTRWTKYLLNVAYASKDSSVVDEFARYLCREWNDSGPPTGKALTTIKLVRVERRVPVFDGRAPDDWHEQPIANHRCR
jgi:hypothetical protein